MSERIVCWFSHGAASAVATKLAMEVNNKSINPKELLIVSIHLKNEHCDNIRFKDECEKWFGQEIIEITSEKYNGDVDSVIEKTRYMSGVAGARCTTELKKNVRKEWQRPDDIHVFGMTCEEENRIDQILDAEPELELWSPLIEKGYTKTDCFNVLHDAGIELPEMYKLGYHNNNPCTLDTRVATTKGVFEIGELIGTTQKVFGRGGVVDAEFNYMGEQPVISLSISKKGMPSKELKFTPDHKWYSVSRRGKRFDGDTSDLMVGDFLPVCDFGGVDFDLDLKYLIWGFCIGDGSLNGDHSVIRAFGEKWEALECLGVEFTSHNTALDMKYLGGLPSYYKKQIIDESDRIDAKMSFLTGLFLADGSCNINGQTCISTSDYVDEVRALITSCGLPVTSIVEVDESGNRNSKGFRFKRTKPCYSINFRAPKSIILKKSHLNNYVDNKRSVNGWRIDEIKSAGVQPVACGTVISGLPEFSLEDMILTGNCVGCLKAAGAGYWNKIREDFPIVFRRRSRQEKMLNTALVMMQANVYFNKHRDSAIENFEHFGRSIKFNGSGPIRKSNKLNNCIMVDKKLLDERFVSYDSDMVLLSNDVKGINYPVVLVELSHLIIDNPDVLLTMLKDKETYPVVKVYLTRTRLPLRFLPEDAGSHRDLDTGSCGFFCEVKSDEQ